MALKVLKQQAEHPVADGGDKPFPAGPWKFTIQETRTRDVPEFMFNGDNPRVAGPGGALLSIWLGNAAALSNQDAVGERKFFFDIVTRDGDTAIGDLDLENPNGTGWLIQRDARLLANLALALGATTEEGEYVVPAPNIVDLLESGAFDGSEVIAQVEHRKYKNRDGERKVDAFISTFAGVE